MAKTGIGKSTKDDETVNNSTTEYALGSGYSKSGRKLPSNAEEAIAAGRYLDDDGYWRTSSGYKLRTGTSQGGGYTTYDGVGGGNKTPKSNNSDADSAVSKLYNYVNGTGSVSSNQPQYSDRYDLSDIIDRLNNMSYEDWTDSDEYEALAERYNLLGKKAMQNTLGQVSGRTGGLASSYATTVAEQANNEYMSQLEEMARSMYENDRDDLESQYKYMSDYNDTLYNRYRDSLSDALAAEQLAYDREQDEKEWAYKLAQANGTSSSSNSGKPKLTAAQAKSALENGTVNDSTLAAYEYWWGEPWSAADDEDSDTTTVKAAGNLNSPKSNIGAALKNVIYSVAKTATNKVSGKASTANNADPTIKNQHAMNSDGEPAWIYVAGIGRIRSDQLYDLVESGDVTEYYDEKNNTLSYFQNPNK